MTKKVSKHVPRCSLERHGFWLCNWEGRNPGERLFISLPTAKHPLVCQWWESGFLNLLNSREPSDLQIKLLILSMARWASNDHNIQNGCHTSGVYRKVCLSTKLVQQTSSGCFPKINKLTNEPRNQAFHLYLKKDPRSSQIPQSMSWILSHMPACTGQCSWTMDIECQIRWDWLVLAHNCDTHSHRLLYNRSKPN